MKSLSTLLGIRVQKSKLLVQLMEAIQNQNFIGESLLSHVSVAIIESRFVSITINKNRTTATAVHLVDVQSKKTTFEKCTWYS